jgi:hypothetical protein
MLSFLLSAPTSTTSPMLSNRLVPIVRLGTSRCGRDCRSTVLKEICDGCRAQPRPSFLNGPNHMAMSEQMSRCIETCLACYKTCLSTAMNHCLETGGKHVEPKHLRLMMACAEICRTSAHFMLINTPHHKHTCRECAEICAECAENCASIGGMDECVAMCRACSESCRAMSA